MAEKKPPEIKFIQVQPPKDETDSSLISEENENAVKQKFTSNGEKAKFYPLDPTVNITGAAPFCDVDIRIPNHIEEMFLAKEMKAQDKAEQTPEGKKAKRESTGVCEGKKKKKKRSPSRRFKNKVEPIDSDTEQELNSKHRADDSPRNQNAVSRKKKKKPKQKKKKEKKSKAKYEITKGETAQIEEERTAEDDGAKIEKINSGVFGFIGQWLEKRKERRKEKAQIEEITEDVSKKSKKQKQFPCVFGFIGQWLAKRKEKRNERERDVLDAAFASVSGLCCDEEYSGDGLNVDDVGIHEF